MKEKLQRFMKEKKEFLIFLGIVVLVFVAAFSVTGLITKTDDKEPVDKTIAPTFDDVVSPTKTDDIKVVTPKNISHPLTGDYIIVKTFYDATLSDEQLVQAIIDDGSKLVKSKGISYAKTSNEVFDVLAIYDGIVVDVIKDELEGTTITINHDNQMVSVYKSLDNPLVSKGDQVTIGQKLATAAQTGFDIDTDVCVHLEVLVDDVYVNPSNIIGKKLEDIKLDISK